MIAVELSVAGGRRARIFSRSADTLPDDLGPVVEGGYWEDDDRARDPLLRHVLEERNVRAVAYPTLHLRDVLQVFLRRGEKPEELLFACVVVGGTRLRAMLADEPWVVEGFALQVAPGEHLSVEGVRAAVQAWVERTFPGVVLPAIALELWTGPGGLREDLLELLLTEKPPFSEAGPTEVRPDPGLAQPPYEEAA